MQSQMIENIEEREHTLPLPEEQLNREKLRNEMDAAQQKLHRIGAAKTLGKILLLTTASVFTVFPFVWMILSALKTKAEVMNVDQLLPAHAQWQNFSEVLLHSPMLTYAMVFMKFRGRKLLFAIVMGTYMLPTAATYIPSYIILAHMGLLDSYTGLIISDAVNIFGIFLLRTAFMQVPQGLIEAARIDGAGHWKVLWRIITPMTKSAYITFGLISFITMYNSYMWPSLVTNNKELSMVSQGLRSFFIEGGAYGTEWPKVMAASAVIVVPLLILFAFTQKWFINGIGGDTGIKG